MPASVSTEAAKPRRARKKGDTAFWRRELKGLVAIVLALFGLLALSVFDPAVAPSAQQSVVGPVGGWVRWAVVRACGYAGFVLPLLLGVWGLSAFLKPLVARGWVPIAGLAVLLVAATGLLQQTSDTFAASGVTRGGVVAAGGFIGWGLATGLHTAVGNVGAWLILVAAVELDRNPTLSRDEIAANYRRTLGVRHVIWLERGPKEEEWGRFEDGRWGIGTGGHIDEFCRFADPTTIGSVL